MEKYPGQERSGETAGPPPPDPMDRAPDRHADPGSARPERVGTGEGQADGPPVTAHREGAEEPAVHEVPVADGPHREVYEEPVPGANWWDDPDAQVPPDGRPEPSMRVLPDGSVVYEDVVEEPVEDETASRSTGLTAGVIGTLLLLLLAIALGWGLAVSRNGGLNPQRRKAVGACHQYVQVRIGATTSSTMTTDFSEGTGYGPWQVQGTVQGTSGNGRPVNARYNCVVDANGDHSTWRLQKLDMF